MMKAFKNLFSKKNEKMGAYGAVEKLLVNLSGDIIG